MICILLLEEFWHISVVLIMLFLVIIVFGLYVFD